VQTCKAAGIARQLGYNPLILLNLNGV